MCALTIGNTAAESDFSCAPQENNGGAYIRIWVYFKANNVYAVICIVHWRVKDIESDMIMDKDLVVLKKVKVRVSGPPRSDVLFTDKYLDETQRKACAISTRIHFVCIRCCCAW